MEHINLIALKEFELEEEPDKDFEEDEGTNMKGEEDEDKEGEEDGMVLGNEIYFLEKRK